MAIVLALTACVRNEADVLPAFLAYHGALGVRRAYLYLDRCTDRTADVARAFDWVEVLPAERADGQSLEHLQLLCADDALRRARADGVQWLLHLDPDEFAWGGALELAGRAADAGDLVAMLARVDPRTEAVWLRTLEAVPVRRPPGAPFWTSHAMLDGTVLARDVLDPVAGAAVRLDRCIGHYLGKSIARVSADLQSASAHRWTRRQDAMPPAMLPIAEEQRGCHFHYVVRDAAHWQAKYAQMAADPDVWLRGWPMEFPKRSWKRVAGAMSATEAARYFDDWVAVPDDVLAAHRTHGRITEVPHVERVLTEIGFPGTEATRSPGVHRRRCRLAFVGVDAADPGLVRRWAAEGLLPTFARLLGTTRTATTRGPEGFFVGALWPSLHTAVNPARHGVHCWEQLVPGTYDVRRLLAGRTVTLPPFWLTLSRAGRRVCLLDVPLSGTTPGFAGVQVLEWGGHDPEEGFRTQPAELRDAILEAVGLPPVQGNCNAWRDAAAHAAFRDDLVTGVRLRTGLHRWLLARDDWDLFCTVYGESHCVGHQCWHLHDPTHVRHDPAAAWVGDPVLDVYRAIDASLADLLAVLGDETPVVVFLSHGMAPHYDPTFLLDEMVRRLEAADRLEPALPSRWRRAARAAAGALGLRPPFVPAPASGEAIAALAAALTVPERRCFQVTNNQVDGAIRLNVAGREPCGRIHPGREYDETCAWLAAGLAGFVNVETGRPVVEKVVKTRDVYRGERLDWLPDLYVVWRKDGYVRHVASPRTGAILQDYGGVRTGDHTSEGLLMLRAPHVAAGSLERIVDVMDVAPTLTALLGVPFPDVDGRPIAEFLAASPAPRARCVVDA